MTERVQPTTKHYCNLLAMQRGLDPVGSAGWFADAVIVETPPPWNENVYEKAGRLPQEAIDLLGLWLKRYHEGAPYDHLLLLIAPDAAYSRPGFRRVIYVSQPQGRFAKLDKREYLVPEGEVGALLWALFEAKTELPRFDAYRQRDAETRRDLMVCTHGSVDVACAKFGYPLYKHLRQHHAADDLRVWRVSHFGGHVFAPTLVDLPTGHLWGYVEAAQADQIAARTGDVTALRGYYRGWTGLNSGELQAAEWAMWQREGWRWFDYAKQAIILAEQPQATDVRIEFTTPDGVQAYEARVEPREAIETLHTTGCEDTFAYPQYRVTRLEKRA